jgi:cell division GTPase FtsZ
MNILLLSAGGGGGNILRSLKTLFDRDIRIAEQSDPEFAARLRGAVTPRFLDTNEFSVADLPADERMLIGTATKGRMGSRHDPKIARAALEESRGEVERLLSAYSAVIIIATGGKGTGAGTIFPLAEIARRQKKIVLPIFVRPSFERHEVDKRRYDHALRVAAEFDRAKIRLIEILNDRGYEDGDPQPQTVVWERMNLPIARGLRGLLYVLWDLSQVDPSDLSMLLAGHGRLRIGFAEVDPPAGHDPSDEQIECAVRTCWTNSYYAFSKPAGTSLVCIQGDWSNVADASMKGRLAVSAMAGAADSPYNPLYARAFHTPKPWGVTALFAEHTGTHQPLEIDWAASDIADRPPARLNMAAPDLPSIEPLPSAAAMEHNATETTVAPAALPNPPEPSMPEFSRFWDFAVALNRGDRSALALAADGKESALPIDGVELKKLLGTFWFRSVFPRLSDEWRNRLLDALVESLVIPNHLVQLHRQRLHLNELTHDQLREIVKQTLVRGPVGADLQLLLAIANFWGEPALARLTFADIAEPRESSFATLLHGLRG